MVEWPTPRAVKDITLVLNKNNRPQSELDPAWESCLYEITQETKSTIAVYQIHKQDGTQLQWIHCNQLKPYLGPRPIVSENEEDSRQVDSNDPVSWMPQKPLELLLSVGWPTSVPAICLESNDQGSAVSAPQELEDVPPVLELRCSTRSTQ